jgi:hypothetical protein
MREWASRLSRRWRWVTALAVLLFAWCVWPTLYSQQSTLWNGRAPWRTNRITGVASVLTESGWVEFEPGPSAAPSVKRTPRFPVAVTLPEDTLSHITARVEYDWSFPTIYVSNGDGSDWIVQSVDFDVKVVRVNGDVVCNRSVTALAPVYPGLGQNMLGVGRTEVFNVKNAPAVDDGLTATWKLRSAKGWKLDALRSFRDQLSTSREQRSDE